MLTKQSTTMQELESKPTNRPGFQPTQDRILVQVDPKQEKTDTGIYVVTTEEMNQGTCIRVGPESGFEEQDRIIFSKLAGTEITIAKKDYKIMRRSDVFGVIEK